MVECSAAPPLLRLEKKILVKKVLFCIDILEKKKFNPEKWRQDQSMRKWHIQVLTRTVRNWSSRVSSTLSSEFYMEHLPLIRIQRKTVPKNCNEFLAWFHVRPNRKLEFQLVEIFTERCKF